MRARVPTTKRRTGSRSSTAITARSPPRAPARRSVCGARASATQGREGPGSTGRPRSLRGPVRELFLHGELVELLDLGEPTELCGGRNRGLLGRLLVAEHLRVLGLWDVHRRGVVRVE